MEKMVTINNFQANYTNKKVFITGHTGFKGSWLLLWLHSIGAIVKGYALAPENENSLYNVMQGDELCQSVIADIRDADHLKKAIIEFDPDYIFHLAAQPLVRYSYEAPVDTFETNVMGTIHLLEALKPLTKKCAIVIVTTDKVYHNEEKNYRYQEEDKLGGYDPYSASKAASEIAVSSYRNSFFNTNNYSHHQKAIACARAGNVIGGGDRNKDRIIPDIVKSIENNIPVIIRNPMAVRPWQHVLEPLFGYLLLGIQLQVDPIQFSTAFNFGPNEGDELTVKKVVDIALNIWGKGESKITDEKQSQHEAGLLQLNNNKAKTILHWSPKYAAAEAIEKTINWYRFAPSNYRAYSIQQINDYQTWSTQI
jgi:CDP-glucose 4,6-dehydratase